MTISTNQAAQAARDLITEQSESVAGYSVPKILAMIPLVVKDYSLEVARDPARRNYARTAASTSFPIASGVTDLTTLFSTSKAYRELFELAELYVENAAGVPPVPVLVKLVRARQQLSLTRAAEGEYVYGWWDGGARMEFRSTAGSTTDLNDNLLVQASKELADDLSDLDDRLHQDFIKFLAVRAAAELGRGGQQQQPAAG